MTQICLLPFSFNLKIYLSLLLILSGYSLLKNLLKKDTSPNVLNSQKLKQELGDFLGPKNPTGGTIL